MDENPYLSPQSAGGFQEELGPVTATFVLRERMLDKEAYRLAELSGCGSFLAISVFMCVLFGAFITADESAIGPAHPVILLLLIIGGPVVTHVLVNRFLARRRIRNMQERYDITAGDLVKLEVSATRLRYESERVRWEWPLSRVGAVCMKRDLTIVVDDVVTIPVDRNADCGEWDFASFIAICAEHQRRYRKENPFVVRFRRLFQKRR